MIELGFFGFIILVISLYLFVHREKSEKNDESLFPLKKHNKNPVDDNYYWDENSYGWNENSYFWDENSYICRSLNISPFIQLSTHHKNDKDYL